MASHHWNELAGPEPTTPCERCGSTEWFIGTWSCIPDDCDHRWQCSTCGWPDLDAEWVRAMIESLRLKHRDVGDCWYSCPKSEGGCCNDDYADDECTCEADKHNATVDALLRHFDGREEAQ